MIRTKLVKGFMLGLCFAALTTGTAFAQSVAGSTPSYGGEEQSEELKELYAKQSKIDQYLLVDHVKEIEEKGFMINYTSVSGNVVEIGISPFTEENANYLYELFGNTEIKVVEFDQSVIYSTTVMDEPIAADGAISDKTAPDAQVQPEEDGEFSIQIESLSGDVTEDAVTEDAVLYNKTDENTVDTTEVQLVSAAENNVLAEDDAKETKDGVSAPLIVLAIAGGAALIGGSVIVTNKKKTAK